MNKIILLVVTIFLMGCSSDAVANWYTLSDVATIHPICEPNPERGTECKDCTLATGSNYGFVRSLFCLDKEASGSFTIRSMRKKYRHWPMDDYPHVLLVWYRINNYRIDENGIKHDNWQWELVPPMGSILFNNQWKKQAIAAKEKAEVLKYHLDSIYPDKVVAFSYLLQLHEATIMLENDETEQTHIYVVNELNKLNTIK